MLKLEDKEFKPASTGFYDSIDALWGTSDKNLIGVGFNGRIVRYDGQTWKTMDSQTEEHLRGVWGSSKDDVWAALDSGSAQAVPGRGDLRPPGS